MENKMQIFTNSEFGEVRTLDEDGVILFCGNDVAKALGYANAPDALNRHCRAIVKRDTPISGKIQEVNFIPESDVYRLIFTSKLPNAEKFTDWVTSEVLPAIRKTGTYSIEPYKSKRTSAGEVASLIKVIKGVMKDQHSPAEKIAEMTQMVCQQFNVDLPDKFVVKPMFVQLTFEIPQ